MRTYIFGLLAVGILALGNELGIYWGLYASYGPYDIFMHILGGLGIGLFLAALIEMHGQSLGSKKRLIILGVILAGVAWELFEAYYNIAGAPTGTMPYYIDTTKDLIDDVMGAIIAVTIEAQRIARSSRAS